MVVFVPIVEGHGEVQAVPALLHRLVRSANPALPVRINPPIRVKSGSFVNDDDYFHRQLSLAAAKARQTQGHVLILLDCDDDCPAQLGPKLLARAKEVRADVSVSVCLARREYETWFIAAADSLRGIAGLPDDLAAPADPELYRDAKGWLSERMTRPYDPIIHQLEFTRVFDLDQARSNDSFRHLRAQLQQLVAP
ncbi:MAG: DUF4276 family protein [Propionivibrio sp.]